MQFFLPPGHPTIALNQGQISQMLKLLADEAVRSSIKSMKNLIQQASRMILGTCPVPSSTSRATLSSMSVGTNHAGSQFGFTFGHSSDTSEALRTDDDFASIGFVYEHSDF